MKKIFIVFFLFIIESNVKSQQSMNMELLANWNDTTLEKIDGDQLWSDIIGYYDSINKKEFAIMMGNDSIYFFDITNPRLIKLVAVKDGFSKKSINRDVEIYSHYAYCTSERSGSLGGLQIFDLKYLPDSVSEIYRSSSLTAQAHTLFIETSRKRMYICQNSTSMGFSAMDIISLDNPENPVKLASLNVPLNSMGNQQFDKVHEMFSRNDTVYLSCYESGLFIMDLRNLNDQKLLSIISNYPQKGTNHSSWLNEKGDVLMFTDENLGSPIKLFDIKDIFNPRQIVYFNSHPNALPHNAYWNKNSAIVSSYEDGVYVYDLTIINTPKVHAYFDTYLKNPDGVYSGFHGCWGVWPYLPSGNIVASDISEGLFVLKIKNGLGTSESLLNESFIKIYPNPAINNIGFKTSENITNAEIQVCNAEGNCIKQFTDYNLSSQLDIADLKTGLYFLIVNTNTIKKTIKFLKL